MAFRGSATTSWTSPSRSAAACSTAPKLAWEGNQPVLPPRGAVGKSIASLGLVTPAWMREKSSDLPEVGRFGSSVFDPEAWTSADPLPPFVNRLPDDTFWAARQVMAFTDEDIRAIVQVGQYSKPAEDWITATLIERRNRIGRTYFARVLPLDHIRLEGNTLAFDDLGVSNGFAQPRTYTTTWYRFDNAKRALLETIGTGAEVPGEARALPDGSYVAARIHAGAQAMNVTVFLRRHAGDFQVVGIDRSWPGKNVVTLPPPPRADRRAYADLMPRQQELFQTYVDSYNATRGSHYSAEEAIRAPDRLGTDHVLRRHARAAAYVADRLQWRRSRSRHRSGRGRQSDRGTIRRPRRRPAVPNLRHLEAGHP